VQRVLSRSDQLAIGFTADGIQFFMALKNYLSVLGLERTFVVTDAVSAAEMGPGEYPTMDRTVIVDEGLATWEATIRIWLVPR